MVDDQAQKKTKFVNIFHNPVTAWLILFLSLGLTFSAYHISSKLVKERARDRFESRVFEIEKAIEERLRIYEQQLWSGVGFIYAVDNLERSKFAKFVETMNIENHWPGIQGFGFSVPVAPKDKQSHIDAIRAEGFPDFTIRPQGDRDFYSSIIYLEPFDWRNQRAFGYDMWSNDMRRAAMKRARDEGVAATSGIITLVQETEEDVQRGFLTYVPVYKSKTIPETLQERRDQFMGWVYAPYRAGNLMQGIPGTDDPDLEFEVFDDQVMNEDTLLFDTNDSLHLNEKNYQPKFEKLVQVINQGRLWTLHFNTPHDFVSSAEQRQPLIVAIVGLIVDFLLFYVIYSIYFLQKKASQIAQGMTKELQQRSKELEVAKNSLEKRVHERTKELEAARADLEQQVEKRTRELEKRMKDLERINEVMVGREERMIELKQENKKLKEKLG